MLREEIIHSGAGFVVLSFERENTPAGILFLNLHSIVSGYDRGIIRARTMAGMRSKILTSNVPRDGHFYGCTFAGEKKNGTDTYVVKADQADAVQLVCH